MWLWLFTLRSAMMDWWPSDFIYALAGAIIAGGLIGFEREYRGRSAGLRTHMLVCLASALLMLAAVHQMRWLTDTPDEVIRIDPVRMAHGILTGIGFLCGGVIFRQGLSVHGLTTAASLWITSALGVLYGVGFYGLAVGGTVVTVTVLTLLRALENVLPKLELFDVTVRYRREGAPTLDDFRRFAAELGLNGTPLRQKLCEGGAAMEIAVQLKGSHRAGAAALIAKLSDDPRVVAFEVAPRRD